MIGELRPSRIWSHAVGDRADLRVVGDDERGPGSPSWRGRGTARGPGRRPASRGWRSARRRGGWAGRRPGRGRSRRAASGRPRGRAGGSRSRSARPTASSTRSASLPGRLAPFTPLTFSAYSTFSSAVSAGNRLNCWKTKPIDCPADRGQVARARRGRPRRRRRPRGPRSASGCSRGSRGASSCRSRTGPRARRSRRGRPRERRLLPFGEPLDDVLGRWVRHRRLLAHGRSRRGSREITVSMRRQPRKTRAGSMAATLRNEIIDGGEAQDERCRRRRSRRSRA